MQFEIGENRYEAQDFANYLNGAGHDAKIIPGEACYVDGQETTNPAAKQALSQAFRDYVHTLETA